MRVRAALIILTTLTAASQAQLFFQASDGTTSFTKAPFADPNDSANWDVITPSVAITRGNNQGIFNPLQEDFYFATSPAGTLWKFDSTVQDVIDGTVTLADFTTWAPATGNRPPSTVGNPGVLYLEELNAFVDITFTDWGVGAVAGGGFTYTRAIVPAPASGGILAVAGLLGARRRRR